MDFSLVKRLFIPQGEVTKITNLEGITLWQKISRVLKEWRGLSPLTCTPTVAGELNEVKVYGNSKQQLLPDGYTQLEYIESTGTQYIDTGINPTIAKSTEIQIKLSETRIFSISNGFGLNSSLNIVNISDSYWRANGVQTNTTREVGKIFNITLKQTSQGRYYNINGEEGYGSVGAPVGSFHIGILGGTTTSYKFNAKWYYCKTLENNVLVQNLIPAKRNSDNVLGMYDTVTNTFFTNAGAGTFIAGGTAPTPTTPIEVESVGEKTSNLFDGEWEYGNIDANGNVIISTTPTAWIHDKNRIKVKPNTRYWFRLFGDVTRYQAQFYIIGYDKDDKFITGKRVSVGDIILNVDGYYYDMASNVEYIRFFYYHTIEESTSLDTNRYKLSIEERSDVIPSYEPYGYKVPVEVSGKNLIDQDDFFSTITTWDKVDGIWHGSIKYIADKYNGYDKCYPINVDVASFSIKARTEVSTTIYIKFFYTDGTSISANSKTSPDELTSVFLASDPNKKIKGVALSYSINSYADIIDMIIVEGTYTKETMPSYQPYIQPTTTNIYLNEPLRKIGEYADTLSVDGTDVTVVRNVGVLDTKELANLFQGRGNASSSYIGSQFVQIFSSGTQQILTKYNFGGAYASRNNRFNVLCTKLVPLNTDFSQSTYKYGMVGIDTSLNLFIDTTKPANTTEMAQRIRDLGLELVLPLNTPTTETYTIENPILALDNTSIINVDTTVPPSEVYASEYVEE